MSNILEVSQLYKSFGEKEQRVEVLKGISFSVAQGAKVVVTGESGSGKTTLLSTVSGLDTIDAGSIVMNGVNISNSNEIARAKFRLHNIGFVFQHHYLLQDFTALGNIMIPLTMIGMQHGEAKERAMQMLEKVGLAHRKTHLPSEMSGGECQRTAIARALVHRPSVVLADEPTGALDNKNSENIRELMCDLVNQEGATLLVATHDTDFLSIADMHWHFEEGIIKEDK